MTAVLLAAAWWGPRNRGSDETQLGADIYEINPDKEIVWEWHAHNHLDLNRFSPATPEGDWLHVNSIAPLPENQWYDAGDTRFRPGNILVNVRNIDTMYIVDKETKAVDPARQPGVADPARRVPMMV